MTLKEEIEDVVYDHLLTRSEDVMIDDILKLIEKRIDSMIGVDNQTINRKRGTYEGRIAAQASKNALILVKEMLK